MKKMSKEEVVCSVAQDFSQLSDQSKNVFVWDTLDVLVNMTPSQMKKMIKRFVKRGRPSKDDVEMIHLLVLMFLFSIKPEFRPIWGKLVYKFLKQPVPESIEQKVEDERNYSYLHIRLTQDMYERVTVFTNTMDPQDWNYIFDQLLPKQEQGDRDVLHH